MAHTQAETEQQCLKASSRPAPISCIRIESRLLVCAAGACPITETQLSRKPRDAGAICLQCLSPNKTIIIPLSFLVFEISPHINH